MRRLVIVLADGLRPDAISPSVMPSLSALGEAFTLALHAHTVRPSATVAALASLATGVGPDAHPLIEPGLRFLPGLGSIRPVARVLADAGVPTDVVTGDLGPAALPVAWALASTAGVRRLVSKGDRARDTAQAAQRLLGQREERLLFLYLPDCDRMGHAYGWMSQPYLEAAAEIDAAIGLLSAWTDEITFVVTADHGGGGVFANEHDEPHPVNDHIPLVLAGPDVTRRHRFWSAGSEPGALHPLAVAALAEVGVDISHQRAKGLPAIPLDQVDTIVTLCAEEVCPIVAGTVARVHWPLPDPARVEGSEAERLAAFRAARDRLKELLPQLWS